MSNEMLRLRDYLKVEINGRGVKFIINLLLNPSFNAVFLIRLYQFCRSALVKKLIYRRLVRCYGIFIGENTEIGIGLTLGHPNGIVFGDGVKMGRYCTIYQQVTFGVKNFGDELLGKYPIVGDDCIFAAGSKVLGPIYVADGTIVGANAVLIDSTERNSVYVGSPAKRIIKSFN